jgi:hypothetical protein
MGDDIENRNDVGVIQSSSDASFLLEAAKAIGVL